MTKPNGKAELYNLANDPAETKDLADTESARVDTMTARMVAIRGKDLPQPNAAKKTKK